MSASHTSDQLGQESGPHAGGERDQSSRPQAQYAELDPNTAPQVYFSTAPEVVLAPIEPDVAHQRPSNATPQAGAEEKTQDPQGFLAKLGKRKVMWLIGLVVAICIILAVSISVPLVGDKIGRSSKAGGEASVSAPTSPTMTDSTISGSTTGTKVPGCERNKYTSNVDWVGIRDGKDWDFELKGFGSAAECCGYCYETAKECNAWLYVPSKGPGPDCTLIVKYGGDDPDDECPNGRPDVMFNMDDDKLDSFAGIGPCAGFTKLL